MKKGGRGEEDIKEGRGMRIKSKGGGGAWKREMVKIFDFCWFSIGLTEPIQMHRIN